MSRWLLSCAVLCACGGPPEVARIEVEPGSVLLLGAGDTWELSATGRDADGEVVDAEVTWVSDESAVVAVDETGVLTGTAVGSTWVRATAGEAEAAAFVFVAEVGDGVIGFTDDQVVGGPDLLPGTVPLVGSRFALQLSGVDATVGDLLVAREETPAGGRVVGAAAEGAGTRYELEVVPLTTLFDALSLDVSGTIGPADLEDGARATEFEVGPFECEADGEIEPELDTDELVYAIVPDLDYDFDVDIEGGEVTYALVRVGGSVHAEASGTLGFPTNLSGELTCEAELASPNIPVFGALSWFVSPKVPLGIGLELEGEAEVDLAVDLEGSVGASVNIGFEFDPASGGFHSLDDFSFDNDLEAGLDLDALAEGASAEARVYLYGFAHLAVGVTLADDLDVTLVEVDAGLQQKAELAHPVAQVDDETSSSSYQLDLHGELAAGEDVDSFLEYLGLDDTLDLSVDHDLPLGASPTGAFTYSPDTIELDEELTGTVTLGEGTSYPIVGYNVDAIHVYGVVGDPPSLHLLDSLPATADQDTWEFAYTPDAADVALGIDSLAAFVVTKALPGVPLELETTAEAGAGLQCGGLPFQIVPQTTTVVLESTTPPSPPVYSNVSSVPVEFWANYLTPQGTPSLSAEVVYEDLEVFAPDFTVPIEATCPGTDDRATAELVVQGPDYLSHCFTPPEGFATGRFTGTFSMTSGNASNDCGYPSSGDATLEARLRYDPDTGKYWVSGKLSLLGTEGPLHMYFAGDGSDDEETFTNSSLTYSNSSYGLTAIDFTGSGSAVSGTADRSVDCTTLGSFEDFSWSFNLTGHECD